MGPGVDDGDAELGADQRRVGCTVRVARIGPPVFRLLVVFCER